MQSWNFDTMWVLINALCKPSLGAPGHVTKILQAKGGQKVDDFEPIYLGNYRYWWKMVCNFWAHYQLAFFWLCSFTPTWILFFFFFCFFLTFFSVFIILFLLSTFKPLNALYSKFERLKISRRTNARLKLGGARLGDPPQTGSPKFWTFKPLELDKSNFRMGRY